jgi:hypothetical protein
VTGDAQRRAAARTLFDEGLTSSDAGRWAEAADRFERAMLGVAVPVDPGDHLVQARTRQGTALSRTLAMAEGAVNTVTLDLEAPPRPPRVFARGSAPEAIQPAPFTFSPTVSSEPPAGGRRRWVWIAVAGVAAAAAVALAVPLLHGGHESVSGNVGTWDLGR